MPPSEKNIHISVVSPVYQAETIIDELVLQIVSHVSKITDKFEIILVDDASTDSSWAKIEENGKKDTRVKGIKLSRNFGQPQAITAGLKYAMGEWVIVMDCDLQDRPDEIPNLYKKAMEGYDLVSAKRMSRKDSFFRLIFSNIYHGIFSSLSGIKTDQSLSNFGIYNHKVITQYNSLKDSVRSFPILINYLGFKKCFLEVRHSERYQGKSSYSLDKLFASASSAIIGHSNKPLILSVSLGFAISICSFLLALYNVVAYFSGRIGVPGFTTTVFSIWFSTGIIIFNLGIVGIYIGKVFEQVKLRPLFVVDKKLNIPNDVKPN